MEGAAGRRLSMPLWMWVVGSMVLLVVLGLWFDRRFSGRDIKSHGDSDPHNVGPFHGGGPYAGM
jgi:hypothetical protein